MTSSLTPHQAYAAMFKFLEKYYELTNADDIGALLGSMQMAEDGKPMDPAMWDEWVETLDGVCNTSSDAV
jgi:hypothetical protein